MMTRETSPLAVYTRLPLPSSLCCSPGTPPVWSGKGQNCMTAALITLRTQGCLTDESQSLVGWWWWWWCGGKMLDELFAVSLCALQMKLDLLMQIRPNDDFWHSAFYLASLQRQWTWIQFWWRWLRVRQSLSDKDRDCLSLSLSAQQAHMGLELEQETHTHTYTRPGDSVRVWWHFSDLTCWHLKKQKKQQLFIPSVLGPVNEESPLVFFSVQPHSLNLPLQNTDCCSLSSHQASSQPTPKRSWGTYVFCSGGRCLQNVSADCLPVYKMRIYKKNNYFLKS